MKTQEDMEKMEAAPILPVIHGGTQRKDKSRKQLGCYLGSDGASQTLPSPLSKTLYKVPIIDPS